MTTFDSAVVWASQRALHRVQTKAERRARLKTQRAPLPAIIQAATHYAMYIAGLTGLTIAAWTFDSHLGWAAAGASALVFERVISE